MALQLDREAPVVVLDTSTIVDLAIHQARYDGFAHRFRTVVSQRWGHRTQFLVHPMTLLELATNQHEEVQQARSFGSRQRKASELASTAAANRLGLLVLTGQLRKDADLGVDVQLIVPTWEDWSLVMQQRSDFRNLRCTGKSGVIPVSGIADHLILGLAVRLREAGYNVGFTSSDVEQLGAAVRMGLAVLFTRKFDRAAETFSWKDCAKDESCIGGCVDGVAACEAMFT